MLMNESNNLSQIINSKQSVGIIILKSDSFSSKLFKSRLDSIKLDKSVRIFELANIIYYAELMNVISVPAVMIFHNGKLDSIHRGVMSTDEISQIIGTI